MVMTCTPLTSQGSFLVQPDAYDDFVLRIDTPTDSTRDFGTMLVRNCTDTLTLELTMHRIDALHPFNDCQIFAAISTDTVEGTGQPRLPEDTLTYVAPDAAWEYCRYFKKVNDYGYYDADLVKHSNPTGMGGILLSTGLNGRVRIHILKSLLGNARDLRIAYFTFKSGYKNQNPFKNGGSSASDVTPGGSTAVLYGVDHSRNDYTDPEPNDPDPGSGVQCSVENTYYYYDGINPIAEYASNGQIKTNYVYAGGLHLAMITPNPDEAKMDTLFYHCDALGSPRKMSKMNGSIVWTQWYFPFGEPLSYQGQNSHKFTGKELDDESGLYYFCQRYYNSYIGRFITLDPFGGFL